ncbi:hypothetical protein R3P38DRAFT_1662432 [Favolaschia claudopus]|uniref:Uncharacterized protein n=1 Tax=Favolaschia claudopus TaxID=2862362 RepID=A0AAW0AF56_9AGAR
MFSRPLLRLEPFNDGVLYLFSGLLAPLVLGTSFELPYCRLYAYPASFLRFGTHHAFPVVYKILQSTESFRVVAFRTQHDEFLSMRWAYETFEFRKRAYAAVRVLPDILKALGAIILLSPLLPLRRLVQASYTVEPLRISGFRKLSAATQGRRSG